MELKGKYKLTYTIDKVPSELILDIELKQAEGMYQKGRNLWEGVATLDGQPYKKEDLLKELARNFKIEADKWEIILAVKQKKIKIKKAQGQELFIAFVNNLEEIIQTVDAL